MELWLVKIVAPWEWFVVGGQIVESVLYAVLTGVFLYFFVGHLRDESWRRTAMPFVAENVYTIYEGMRHVIREIEKRADSELIFNDTHTNTPVLSAYKKAFLDLDEKGKVLVSVVLDTHHRIVGSSVRWLLSMGANIEGVYTVTALEYEKCGFLPYFMDQFLRGRSKAVLVSGKLSRFQQIARAFQLALESGLQEYLTEKQRQGLVEKADLRPPSKD